MGRTKLSVVLMLVCAVKCLAMSLDELEDFADYLEKTSQLSTSLKKGVSADEIDEDDVPSDHAWEDSGKFEGDLILNDRQRQFILKNVAEGLARNGIQDSTKRWPNNEVIFAIQVEHFSQEQVEAILAGIEDLAQASCIKFRPYVKGDQDAVVIQGNRRGCFSQVGYHGGYQVLNLSARHPVGRGCFRPGTVVHEFLHTLGFYHMQSTPERDDYVDIHWENIAKRHRHNFRKYDSFSVADFGVGYDYGSVLHYSRRAFSTNGKPTIVPKQAGVTIGQRLGLSDKDTQKLNKMYCDADSDKIFDGAEAADDDGKEITKPKKKKNKPFLGQGLGYHQGKAVVIKVLPEAETYRLTADEPSTHMFDYFSKTPQILPSSESEKFLFDKEITYSYKPPQSLIPHIHAFNEPVNYNMQAHEKLQNQDHHHYNGAVLNTEKKKKPTELEVHKDLSSDTLINAQAEEEDASLIEAFDRLSKIIKTHVYPSQTPDLSIYKMFGQIREEKREHTDKLNARKELGSQHRPESININYFGQPEEEKKETTSLIAAKKENKDKKYDDSPYTIPFHEEHQPHITYPYTSPERYQEGDDYAGYSAKIRDGKTSNDNNDDWHEKITPYKYNPSNYYSDPYGDNLKHDYYGDGNSYGAFAPKLEEYSYRSPYEPKKYNAVSR